MSKSVLNLPKSLQFIIITILALGLFFRFANLDQKMYWYDESYTSLRISGYTEVEVVEQAFQGEEVSASFLQKFQHVNSENGVMETVRGLAQEEPQVTPLYFVILRSWVELFGSSIAATRALSACISLLIIPGVYWLCYELFGSTPIGSVAALLIAISPTQILYAQDARMYSLWAVTTLLSSIAILRAVRLPTTSNWLIYELTIALGLYTHFLSLFTAIGFGFYLLIIEKFKLTKTILYYLLTTLAGIILFLPWIFIVVRGYSQVNKMTNWANQERLDSVLALGKAFIISASRCFFDIGLNRDSSYITLLSASIIYLILTALISYSIFFLCKSSQKRAWSFVIILITIVPLGLLLRGLFGQGAPSPTRYFVPSFLGVQIAVAHLLTAKLSSIFSKTLHHKLWYGVIAIVVSCGVASCVVSFQSKVWPNKGDAQNFKAALVINQSSQPLVVSSGVIRTDGSIVGNMLSMSHLLDSKVRLRLAVAPQIPSISDYSGDIFLYRSSEAIRRELQQTYEVESVDLDDVLYVLKRKTPNL